AVTNANRPSTLVLVLSIILPLIMLVMILAWSLILKRRLRKKAIKLPKIKLRKPNIPVPKLNLKDVKKPKGPKPPSKEDDGSLIPAPSSPSRKGWFDLAKFGKKVERYNPSVAWSLRSGPSTRALLMSGRRSSIGPMPLLATSPSSPPPISPVVPQSLPATTLEVGMVVDKNGTTPAEGKFGSMLLPSMHSMAPSMMSTITADTTLEAKGAQGTFVIPDDHPELPIPSLDDCKMDSGFNKFATELRQKLLAKDNPTDTTITAATSAEQQMGRHRVSFAPNKVLSSSTLATQMSEKPLQIEIPSSKFSLIAPKSTTTLGTEAVRVSIPATEHSDYVGGGGAGGIGGTVGRGLSRKSTMLSTVMSSAASVSTRTSTASETFSNYLDGFLNT
ncbi:hypothetical protein HK102_002409, partial [Quaeritorhiza haematococci]